MNEHFSMNHRAFIVGSASLGGGLAVGLGIPQVVEADAPSTTEITAWVAIRPDDTVLIRIAKSEMGQGTLTGLAQLVAEELDCDWSKVSTEFPTPGQNAARDRVWGSFETSASRGIRESQPLVRKGGAIARHLLVQAAANEWGVPASECDAANSIITHRPSGRATSFGKVASAAAKLPAPSSVTLKDPKDWKLIGKSVKRLDTVDKLTGKLTYPIDLRLPGMLNAAIRACPVFGGKVKAFDAAKVESMPGVRKVVLIGDSAVAVVAETWWQAKAAVEALPVEWDEGEHAKVSSASISDFLDEGLRQAQAIVGNQVGEFNAAIAGAKRKVEATYGFPYQAHAQMEPLNATALYTESRCEVWVGTQNGDAALGAVVESSGLPVARCEVHKMPLGGGFGRRGRTDFIRQAVLIAKQLPGVPVKLIWSREEDMTHCTYHPITKCRIVAGLDEDGGLKAMHVRISGQSILAHLFPQFLQQGKDPLTFHGLVGGGDAAIGYTIPNLLVDHAMRNPHVPVGTWRGVNSNQNAFYLESFVDEVAHAAGQDPLTFRRRLMAQHPKHLAVLNAVAERVRWDTKPRQGVHRGLAQMMCYGSYVAACAEISLADQKLKIHRIVAAIDCGHAVNPEQVKRQIEGSFAFSLSALFYQVCTVREGRIEQKNFDDYNVIRMAEMPQVESIVMPSGGFWGGVGEPTGCVGPAAVVNAIFAATGKRIRTFPLSSEGISIA